MDEQTQTPPDAGASADIMVDGAAGVPAADPAVAAPLTDEQKLERLLRRLTKGLVAAVAIFAVVYFFGQRQSHVEQAAPLQDTAVASAEAAVRSDPNNIDTRLKLAETYETAHRSDDALAQLEEILKVQPTNRPALLGIGMIKFNSGDLEQAIASLTEYVNSVGTGEFAAADPKLEQAYYTLGLAELKSDDPKSAAAHFLSAVKIDTGDADAWNSLGIANNQLKQYAAAAEAFQRALAFVPTGWCEPYQGMSEAFDGLGESDGSTYAAAMARICAGGGAASAAPLLDLLKGRYAVNALLGLGLASENDHDTAAALSYYQQLLSLDRTNVAALAAIARLGATPAPQPVTGSSS